MTLRRVTVLDLTVDEVERIELAVGRPFSDWRNVSSDAALYRAIYAAATGTDPAEIGRATLRELTEAISLDDDAEGEQSANP